MSELGVSNLWIVALLILVAFLLWALARGYPLDLRRLFGERLRVQTEDVLKQLYHFEYEGRSATVVSLAGAVGLPSDRVADLVRRLEVRGLVATFGGEVRLSESGRTYALSVIRAHRLWERFLADRTNVPEAKWHGAAERREHWIDDAEAESLAARLGHPTHDPHGDPIPTREGDIPPRRGVALDELEPGSSARVVHVEDEPDSIYAELSAAGFHPGLRLRLLARTHEEVRLLVRGNEVSLAPLVAANVSVVREVGETAGGQTESLADLQVGERAEIIGLSFACRGPERERLLDLGFVAGTEVGVLMVGPMGDPIAYSVRGAVTALRREQAAFIEVRRAGAAVRLPVKEA